MIPPRIRRKRKPVDPQNAVALAMREEQLSSNIRETCDRLNFLCYHTHDSRRSQPGFPDWCIVVRGYCVLFVELKREKEKLTPIQEVWRKDLESVASHWCGRGRVMYAVWSPSDWLSGHIQNRLMGLAACRL